MYINFEQMMSSGLTISDVANLLMIRQREPTADGIPKERIDEYIGNRFIEQQKNGKYKITPRGGSVLTLIETPGLTPEIEGIRDAVVRLYDSFGRDPGAVKEVEKRLVWFVSNTNFRKGPIVDAVQEHLETSGEYTMRLENLIWKPGNAFASRMSLADSKLFDLILKRYKLNSDLYLREGQNKEINWLFAVSRLPDPPGKMDPSLTMTGSVETDIDMIRLIKEELGRRLRKSL